MNALQNGILIAIEAFTKGASPVDDVTLLVVRYSGPSEDAVKTD